MSGLRAAIKIGRIVRVLFLLAVFFSLHSMGGAQTRSAAEAALNEGRSDDASRLLHARLAADPRDAFAHQLLCRVYFAEDMFNSAIRECEAATADATSESMTNQANNYLWLGRARGLKASQANPLVAFTLARKAVAAFAKAVELDPANIAALRDLGEYYVNAPAIAGGGLDKARALAAKMMPVSAAKAHRLLGQIAEKEEDYAAAEAEFKRAIEAQHTPDSYVDLAQFYLNRKQFDRTLPPIQVAARLDRPRDASAVDAASILIEEGRSLPLAEQLLREYLASPAESDAAPAFKVHLQLGDLLLKNSNLKGAKREFDAAFALAPQFKSAERYSEQAARQAPQTSGANAIP